MDEAEDDADEIQVPDGFDPMDLLDDVFEKRLGLSKEILDTLIGYELEKAGRYGGDPLLGGHGEELDDETCERIVDKSVRLADRLLVRLSEPPGGR